MTKSATKPQTKKHGLQGSAVDGATQLRDESDQRETAARAEQLAAYRLLLSQSSKPKTGDAERLHELAIELGKSMRDVRADLAVVTQAVAFERQAKDVEQARSALERSRKALDGLLSERDRIGKQLEIARKSYGNNESALRQAHQAGVSLRDLKQRNAELFGA